MENYHYSQLKWLSKGSTTEWHSSMELLLEEGYITGEWSGSLDYAPYPRWSITRAGETALKEWERNNLIASTPSCEGVHTAEYGHEVYKKFYCVKCGREVVNSK